MPDIDEIESRMTREELGDMEEIIEDYRNDYANEQMMYFDEDDYSMQYVRRGVESELFPKEEVKEILESLIEKYGEEHHGLLQESLDEWYRYNREYGLDAFDAAVESIEAVELPKDAIDISYYMSMERDEIEEKIADAFDEKWEELRKEKTEEHKNDFDYEDARYDYLNDFHSNNPERYHTSADYSDFEKGVWQKTEDGGWFLPFETNKGSEYSIDVYKQTMTGAPVHDIQFSDSSGSFAVTGAGSAKEVFGKVTTALLSHLQKENPTAASFFSSRKIAPKPLRQVDKNNKPLRYPNIRRWLTALAAIVSTWS